MDKRLILAVAGSGKTRHLIENLNLNKRFLIITYTNCNFNNIKNRIVKKFGYVPENIKLFKYFSFLYSFCFKPFLLNKLNIKGISFESCNNRFAKDNDRYIENKSKRVYANRLAKLIEKENSINDLISRLDKYFDVIMIDEIQDFAGNDFNLLSSIAKTKNELIFVGDFFQHTFDTSADANVNKTLHDDYGNYIKKFEKMGFFIDCEILNKSYRCSPTICKYVTKNLGIEIFSNRKEDTNINFTEDESEIKNIYCSKDIIKLFYQNHYKYKCSSNNWGNSKGENNYFDVCIALNNTTFKHFSNNTLSKLAPGTKNKLYVAITRARGNVFFVEEAKIKKLKK